jgi:lysine 2,3-aminomutase
MDDYGGTKPPSLEAKNRGPWKDVPEAQWKDWHWQLRNRITTLEDLKKVIRLTAEEEEGISRSPGVFRMAIPPYYASLMDALDPNCPIRKLAVPSVVEFTDQNGLERDPLDEDSDSPVPGLTHRYPDRALFLTTDMCHMYCRHCTRKRVVGAKSMSQARDEIDRRLDYIRKTPSIRDVILSGGDPLMLTDANLEYIVSSLRQIPHLEIIRLGTRAPVTMPQRVTAELTRMLEDYHPIWVNTHFNHPKEITDESAAACDRLLRAGIPVGNQTVLLKGINDCPHIMKRLFQGLLKIRVRPYYLFQCDPVAGVGHFRTSVSKGIEIMEMLRGHTSGLAIPTYVIDAPGGGGKVPVMPNYMISQSSKGVIVRNYEGYITMYEEPEEGRGSCPEGCGEEGCKYGDDGWRSHEGVAKLINGTAESLTPADTDRAKRRKKIQKQLLAQTGKNGNSASKKNGNGKPKSKVEMEELKMITL